MSIPSLKNAKHRHLILQKHIFKSISKFQKCFVDVTNIKHCKTLTKLLLSDHKLMIEEGRKMRPKIPRNERIYNTCDRIEDEIHILIEYEKYKYDRIEIIKVITDEVPKFAEMVQNKVYILNVTRK